MTAPFALPDLVNIWNPAFTDQWEADVPCRVVPCFMKFYAQAFAGQNTYLINPTHWVDFDPTHRVLDGALPVATMAQQLQWEEGSILEFSSNGIYMLLRVYWYEARFTNTPKAYFRAWCNRLEMDIET